MDRMELPVQEARAAQGFGGPSPPNRGATLSSLICIWTEGHRGWEEHPQVILGRVCLCMPQGVNPPNRMTPMIRGEDLQQASDGVQDTPKIENHHQGLVGLAHRVVPARTSINHGEFPGLPTQSTKYPVRANGNPQYLLTKGNPREQDPVVGRLVRAL